MSIVDAKAGAEAEEEEEEDAPSFVVIAPSCAQDGSCSRQIQNGLCSGTRKVMLNNSAAADNREAAIYPLTDALRLVPWNVQVEGHITCAYADNEAATTTILDGQGATLLMENLETGLSFMFAHGVQQGLILRNFTIAVRRVYHTLGTLVVPSSAAAATATSKNNNDNNTALIQVSDPELYLPPPPCRENHWLNKVDAIMSWDAENRRPAEEKFDWHAKDATAKWLHNTNCDDDGGDDDDETTNSTLRTMIQVTFTSGHKPTNLPTAPNSILMRHTIFRHHVFELKLSTKVHLQDIWIQSGGGMAVVTNQIKEGLILERIRVAPTDKHVFSVTSDGFHIRATRGGNVLIQDCVIESQGDDGMNVQSSYLEIREWDNNTIYYDPEKDARSAFSLRQGDVVSIYSRRSFTPLNFTSTIVSKTSSQGILVLQDSLPSSLETFDLLVTEATFPDSVSILNTMMRNNRARGALLKTSNVLVKNSTFVNTTGPAIQVMPMCIPNGFCEGHVIRSNWTIENCTFVHNNFWDWANGGEVISVGANVPEWTADNSSLRPYKREQPKTGIQHYDLTIRNNTFETDSCDRSALVGYGIDGLYLYDNQGCFQWTISSSCRNVHIGAQPTTTTTTTTTTEMPELFLESSSRSAGIITSRPPDNVIRLVLVPFVMLYLWWSIFLRMGILGY